MVMLERRGVVKAFFPFHDDERRRRVFALWVKRYTNPGKQPLDQVKVGLFVFSAVKILNVVVASR